MSNPCRLTIPTVNIGGVNYPSQPLPTNLRMVSATNTEYTVLCGAGGAIDPGMSFGAHGVQRLEALGNNIDLQTLSTASGLSRVGVPVEGSDLRFNFVADPEDTNKKAIYFALDSTDPLTAAATRIEASTLGYWLTEGSDYTISFSIRAPSSWVNSNDEQVVFQAKSVDTTPVNPYLALVLGQGLGKWIIRYNANSPPLQASNTVLTPYQSTWQTGWQHYVIHINRHWLTSKNPFVRIWQNGNLILNYSGAISYNVPGDVSQIKIGLYHYTPPAWEAPLGRSCHFKGLFVWPGLVDPSKALTLLQSI